MITKNLLEELYFEKNMSMAVIGNMLNLSGATISYYFKKFNIKSNRTQKLEINISKELLEDLYINNRLKIHEIAEKINISTITVSKYLNRFCIPIRGAGSYNILPEIIFNDKQYDFFDGLMISDGSLVASMSDGRRRNAKISCAFKYEEFAKYIINNLDLNSNVGYKIHKSDRYKNGSCGQYWFMSQNNIFFTKERGRWYPSGIKKIPNNFRFSPTSMNIAYLGDGSISDGAVSLSLNAFSHDEIDDIIGKKLTDIGLKFTIQKTKILRITRASTPDFLSFIGKCPVKCYEYKWKMEKT